MLSGLRNSRNNLCLHKIFMYITNGEELFAIASEIGDKGLLIFWEIYCFRIVGLKHSAVNGGVSIELFEIE